MERNHTARGYTLGALGLALCVVLTLAMGGIGGAKAIDLEQNCSLTVLAGEAEGIEEASVVADLYRVAAASSAEGQDTLTFQPEAAYASLADRLENLETITSQDYLEIAQEAAKITLESGQTIAPAAENIPVGQTVEGFPAGLYLIVAHDATETDYVTHITDEDGNEKIATQAFSKDSTYTYLPELISLPTKEADENGQVNTAGSGEWLFDVTATLKPEQSQRFGSLEIVKTLGSYVSGKPGSFVFQVEAYEDETKEKNVYSNVVTISFDGAGQRSVLLENVIPIGAYVEVTEVYSGSVYSLTGDATQNVTVSAEETASVTFHNDYDGRGGNGGGVNNRFDYDQENGWAWTQE